MEKERITRQWVLLISDDGTVVGTLMGYDPLLNLVLDNTVEYLKGELQVKKKRTLKVEKPVVCLTL